MKTACLAIFLGVLVGSVLAGSYQIVYQERIAGAEKFRYIDPVAGAGHTPIGLIFTDSTSKKIVVDFIAVDSTITIPTPYWPVMTLNIWTPDSILVFTLSRDRYLQLPELRRIRLIENTIDDSARFMAFPGWKGNVRSVWHQRISFGSCQPATSGIVIEQCLLCDNYETTQGWEYKAISAAGIYDFNLNLQLGLRPATALRTANLTDNPGTEYAWYNRYYYSYDFRDSWEDPNFGTWDELYSGVSLNSGDTLTSNWTDHGVCLQLFTGDFAQGNAFDELIFHGYATDLTGQHAVASHVACYSFASGVPEEIWYTPLSGVTLDYVYKPQHFIAGMRGGNKVIALNYWTGLLCDSIDLDRNLTATTFFETGSDPSVLNLVGRDYDTVFVYQFENPTDVQVEPTLGLPSSFTLAQNYPNPFNGETLINFSNPSRQKLTLKIYNVLGQEIADLHDAETPAGEFSVSWGGLDSHGHPVASGVYFVRLSSQTESSLIKMLLLK